MNTASEQLLSLCISGVGPQLSRNIIEYRNKKGHSVSRNDLEKCQPGFEKRPLSRLQASLRIRDGEHPLDESAVSRVRRASCRADSLHHVSEGSLQPAQRPFLQNLVTFFRSFLERNAPFLIPVFNNLLAFCGPTPET